MWECFLVLMGLYIFELLVRFTFVANKNGI